MNNKLFGNNQESSKPVLKMQFRVSKVNNFIEMGLQDGLAGKTPQYPEFLHYYMAWASGYREYLLGESTTPVA
ncbi:MAG: hypothetical protein QNJ60_12920 [Xenococcaceae cyanobacterium MO_188.B19]|nr:hypothetical protein [Xenococcaceae cyanobacterium MO_188.B19]